MWRVVTRSGGPEGREQVHWFADKDEARRFVDRCLAGGDRWRQLDP